LIKLCSQLEWKDAAGEIDWDISVESTSCAPISMGQAPAPSGCRSQRQKGTK
jgi:hypothetical protein